MKKILTAINNQLINEELNKVNSIKIINKDIQYKEGIIEVLEENKYIDIIIISDRVPGNISTEELIKKIKQMNNEINIIYFLKKQVDEKINILKKYNINNIFLNKEININKLISIIENKNYINSNENYSNDNKFKFIIKNKITKNKISLDKNKIITINGKSGSGKTLITIMLAKYLEKLKKKILIIDYNKNIKMILGIKNRNTKYTSKIDIGNYNDLINKKYNYDIVIIDVENKLTEKDKIEVLKNSDINIILLEPNLIGIKETRIIIDKIKKELNNISNFYIIKNKVDKYCVDNEIIKRCFSEITIIGDIKYDSIYNNLINKNFNNTFINSKIKMLKIIKQYKSIFKNTNL